MPDGKQAGTVGQRFREARQRSRETKELDEAIKCACLAEKEKRKELSASDYHAYLTEQLTHWQGVLSEINSKQEAHLQLPGLHLSALCEEWLESHLGYFHKKLDREIFQKAAFDAYVRTSMNIEPFLGNPKALNLALQRCQAFLKESDDERNPADVLAATRHWINFWADEFHKEIKSQKSRPDEYLGPAWVRALIGGQLRVGLNKKMAAQMRKLGLGEEEDPFLKGTVSDYPILGCWIANRPLGKDQQERHKFLLQVSESYQTVVGVHHKMVGFGEVRSELQERLDSSRSGRAEVVLKQWKKQWKKAGFDYSQARKEQASRGEHDTGRRVPKRRLIRSPRDAELVALDWMLYWGFDDAEATPIGPDSGIDVVASRAVAQVKAFMVPIGRPELQNLAGVAAVEKKIPLFFALNGYTPQAIEWGNKAKMALFTFDLQGNPEPVNDVARKYFA